MAILNCLNGNSQDVSNVSDRFAMACEDDLFQ
jgi:hypothetical protein